MAKATTPPDPVLALHGRRSFVDDVTLTQSPIPEASSTVLRTHLDKSGHGSHSTPSGGDSGSSLGLLCLDELSAMSLHTAQNDHTQQPSGSLPVFPDLSPTKALFGNRGLQMQNTDSSDNESNTSDTMMPVVRLADEELQRLADDLSDFDRSSLMLSLSECEEDDRTDAYSTAVADKALYNLGSHQDGDGLEEPRGTGAGRNSSDECGNTSDDSSGSPEICTSAEGVHVTAMAATSPRPIVVGSSSGVHESGSLRGPSSTRLVAGDGSHRADETVRQCAEGQSVESTSLPASNLPTASSAGAGAPAFFPKHSLFELDNPEAQRRLRPMGEDLLSRQQVRVPLSSPRNKSTVICTEVGRVGCMDQFVVGNAGASKELPTSSSDEKDPCLPGQGELDDTSLQLASRYMLPGATDNEEEEDDDEGNFAVSSSSEVTLTGFVHTPSFYRGPQLDGITFSAADQQSMQDFIGDEIFKSGASALDVLQQDDCFFESGLTPAESSHTSWASGAAGSSTLSMGDYIGSRSEALGSLSGQATQRPKFGDHTVISPPPGRPRPLLQPGTSANAEWSCSFNSPSLAASKLQSYVAPPGSCWMSACSSSTSTLMASRSGIDGDVQVMPDRDHTCAYNTTPGTSHCVTMQSDYNSNNIATPGELKKVSPIGLEMTLPGLREPENNLSSHLHLARGSQSSCSAPLLLNMSKPGQVAGPAPLPIKVAAHVDNKEPIVADATLANVCLDAAEQSSIVSYSFVTKITSEAKKAGAASSELAAYIIKLSQQQSSTAHRVAPDQGLASAGPAHAGASVGKPLESSMAKQAAHPIKEGATSQSSYCAGQAVAAGVNELPPVVPDISVPKVDSIVQANALRDCAPVNDLVTLSSAGVPQQERADSACLAAFEREDIEYRHGGSVSTGLRLDVNDAELCSQAVSGCDRRAASSKHGNLLNSPLKNRSPDSSWFWSSGATASSSKSLSLDFSAEDASMLRHRDGTSSARQEVSRDIDEGTVAVSKPSMEAYVPTQETNVRARQLRAEIDVHVRGDSERQTMQDNRYENCMEAKEGRYSRRSNSIESGNSHIHEEAGSFPSSPVQSGLGMPSVSLAKLVASSQGNTGNTRSQPFVFSTACVSSDRQAASDVADLPSSAATKSSSLPHMPRIQTSARVTVDCDKQQLVAHDVARPDGPGIVQPQRPQRSVPMMQEQCTIRVSCEVHVKEVCCVGFSLHTQLEVYNPSSRWVQASLTIVSQTIDGSSEKCGNVVPFIFKQRATLEPQATEIIPILFAPQKPGMYVARLQVDAVWLALAGSEDGSVVMHGPPAVSNLLATAELPRVEALNISDSRIDYGYVPWKCSRHFQLCLVNKGHAAIPLRLIISNLKGSSHGCFSFAIASEVGSSNKVVHNVLLPARCISTAGSTSCDIRPIEVATTFRAPEKPYASSDTAEVFQAQLSVELDNPSAVKPLLCIELRAVVGTVKIHTPLAEGVELVGVCGSIVQQAVPVRNAGSIPFTVQFAVQEEDSNAFAVLPSRAYLNPNEDFKIVVKCDTKRMSSNYQTSMLLMSVEPDGPTFEVKVVAHASSAAAFAAPRDATPTLHEESGHQRSTPKSMESASDYASKEQQCVSSRVHSAAAAASAKLYSNKSRLTFGGVHVGLSLQQSFNLRNMTGSCMRVMLEISLPKTQIGGGRGEPCFQLVGSGVDEAYRRKELVLMPYEDYAVRVNFAPTHRACYNAKLKIFSTYDDVTYMMRMSGYGGVGTLVLESSDACSSSYGTTPTAFLETGRSVWQRSIGCMATRGPRVMTEVLARNTGSRSIFVKPVCFVDTDCAIRTTTGRINVHPEQFVLAPSSAKVVSISCSVSEREVLLCEREAHVTGVVCMYYGDEVMRQKLKRLLQLPNVSSKMKAKHRLADCHFELYFLHEEEYSEGAYLPDDPGEVENFFSSLKACRLELIGQPVGAGCHTATKLSSNSVEVSMEPLLLLEDTLPISQMGVVCGTRLSSDLTTRYPAERPMLPVSSAGEGDDATWTIEPTVVLLTIIKAELERQLKKVKITNNSDTALAFDISWPASYIVVTPENGTVEPRSSSNLCISARAGLSKQLPWTGCMHVMGRSSAKAICIVIEEASTWAPPASTHQWRQPVGMPAQHSHGADTGNPAAAAYCGTDERMQPISLRAPESNLYSAVAERLYQPRLTPATETDHGTKRLGSSTQPDTGIPERPLGRERQAKLPSSHGGAGIYVRHKELFPVTAVKKSSTIKMTLCNRGSIDQKVLLSVSPPFALKQAAVNVRPGHFVKLPVTFHPLTIGSHQGELTITCADGETQSVVLQATCTV